MIYFAQPVAGGPIKIGFSDNVPGRIRQLEAHYGQPLAVLAVIEGDRDREREIHDRFSDLRFGRTEQFRPGPDLLAFIGRPLLVSANPEAVESMSVSESGQKPMIVQIRGSQEYKAWAEGLAAKEGDTLAKLFDRGVRKIARESGYPDPPKR